MSGRRKRKQQATRVSYGSCAIARDSEIEPNDTVGQATALGGPGQFLASGHCASAMDVDHFALFATSGGNASASIDLSGVALASVALLTSDGTVLASTTTDPLAVAAAITGTGGIAVLRRVVFAKAKALARADARNKPPAGFDTTRPPTRARP